MIENLKNKNHLFEMALDYTKVGLLITDPSLPDNPIIFANQGFTNMTGYEKEEIIGKNCRFLQGENTTKSSLDTMRKALGQQESITLQLYNYKKDGTGFWNELSIDSMWNEEEQKTYFVGVQKDVTSEKEKERLLTDAFNEMEQLSTPIVPISEDISVLPLIGTIHHSRLENLTTTISNYLTKSKDDYLILDLSGLYEVDTYVATSILKLHDLTTLIGTNLVITGIRPELAIKTIDIGEKLKHLRTYRTVKDALADLS